MYIDCTHVSTYMGDLHCESSNKLFKKTNWTISTILLGPHKSSKKIQAHSPSSQPYESKKSEMKK